MSGKCDELARKAQQAHNEMVALMRAHEELHQQIDNTSDPKEKMRLREKVPALSQRLNAAMDKDDIAGKRYTDCLRDA